MAAMIQNDQEKEWMRPLMDLRNLLDAGDDRDRRGWRRINGAVQLMSNGRVIPGPYKPEWRARWLREALKAQVAVRRLGPPDVRSIELITLAELEEIRRLWVFEKNEIEDVLPAIYREETGQAYPGAAIDDGRTFKPDQLQLLREVAPDDRAYEMCRDVLAVALRHRLKRQRKPVQEDMARVLRRHLYLDEADALRSLGAAGNGGNHDGHESAETSGASPDSRRAVGDGR